MIESAIEKTPILPDRSHEFFRIASFSTALSLGCATAAVYSIKLDVAGITFDVTWGTLAAFVAAAAASIFYWRLIEKGHGSSRWLNTGMIIFGLGLFFYPVRFVAPEKRAEVAVGLTCAVIFLSIAARLIWRCMRYFNSEESAQNQDFNPKSK